jgi:hypothetical protein
LQPKTFYKVKLRLLVVHDNALKNETFFVVSSTETN